MMDLPIMPNSPVPKDIVYHSRSRVLEMVYADGTQHELPAEYLRVNSPSAEVQGHRQDEALLVGGKREVGIRKIETTGNYAIRLFFDDGHNTGIYTWTYLRDLGEHRSANWTRYLQRLKEAGMSREKDSVIPLKVLLHKPKKP